jgi:ATP-dependent RNA helicase DHX29
VDANLFSKYFGDCPVITAEGRTHPVSTIFLEDVYEKINYSLPSDSPASGNFMLSNREKVCF